MATRLSIWFIGMLFFISGSLAGQPYLIQGNIEYADQGKIYLAAYYGDRFRIADSIENSSGSFLFMFPEETPAGIYRLIYPEVYGGVRTENRFVEFIYNHGDVSFNVSGGEAGSIPHFENSVENQVYFEFMTFQLDYEDRLMEVYGQLFPSTPGDPGYESAVARYEVLQHRRNRYMDSLSHRYPELYATKIMNAFRAPVVLGSVPHKERIDTLKRLFFDGASIDDPALLYAPVYTFRIVDYLSLFRVDTLSREQQEQQFIEAVDRIMVNTAPDPELRSFVVEFMLEGFELLGMDMVQLHLADHYLDESCESDVMELVLSRMEGTRKVAEGRTAPDFVIRDMGGKIHRLSDLPNPYVLVMFWASTCEHCRDMIPELHDWYVNENTLDLEVVAISIDSTVSQFEQFSEDAGMQWITTHDLQGWHGKVPGDYHIYATPSLFLLDRERVILSRPLNFRQFQRAIKKLGP
jgi:peroxiredoxin